MDKVVLTLKKDTPLPIEGEMICPDVFAGKSWAEIKKLPLFYGNKEKKLEEFFAVEGEDSDRIEIRGDLRNIKRIGQEMSRGKIHIIGKGGMHLGNRMRGGELVVEGDVGDWLGAEMTGGTIRIRGNAGHYVGAAYRGGQDGLNRGVILIEGNAGNMVGEYMRRGIIVVMGVAGDFAGCMMRGGTIIIFGNSGERPGGGMNRGTIILFQKPSLLPTFRYNCKVQPVFLRVLLRYLQELGTDQEQVAVLAEQYLEAGFLQYSGDISELGKGEILVYDQC
jgi:formylmethanofuran dehydrogenase subunit C